MSTPVRRGSASNDLLDIYNELLSLSDQLVLISNIFVDEYDHYIGRPNPEVIQNAIYAVSQHIERICDDVERIDRKTQ